MKKLSLYLIVVTTIAFLVSCAPVEKNFSTESIVEIEIGRSTESDIIGFFGKPFKKQTRSGQGIDSLFYIYTYTVGTTNVGKGRILVVEFDEGVVNAYNFRSAIADDSTDFDLAIRSSLIAGNSHKSDVKNLLGSPDGIVMLPSNLLPTVFGNIPEIVTPGESSQAWVYNYLIVKRESGLLNKHLKLLIIFMSHDDKIVEVRHFSGVFNCLYDSCINLKW